MFLKHGITYFLAMLAPALASFLTVAFYTRWMGTEEYGIYTTVLMIASTINSVMLGWLQAGVMRFWNDKQVSVEAIRDLITLAVFATSCIVALALTIFAFTSAKVDIAWILVLLFIATAMYEAYQRINSIMFRTNQYLLAEIARGVIIVAIGLSFVKLGYSWVGATLGIVMGNIIVLLFSGTFWSLLKPRKFHIDTIILKKILAYGLPMSLSAILFGIIQISERTLIGWSDGYDTVGEYAAAYNPVRQILFMIASALNMAAYPLIMHALEQEGIEQAKRKMHNYIILYAIVFTACAVGILGIADEFIPILIGPEFVKTVSLLLPWVILSVSLHAFYMFYVSLFFQINKQTLKEVWIIFLATTISVAGNLLLLPQYGVMGAAITAILTYFLCVTYGYFRGKGNFQADIPWLEMGKIALAAGLMYILIEQVPTMNNPLHRLFIKIVFGGATYVALIWLLNVGDVRGLIRTHPLGLKKLLSAR